MGLRRPEQFSHHFAKLREITLHYVREGAGPKRAAISLRRDTAIEASSANVSVDEETPARRR